MDKEEKQAYDRAYHANRSPEAKARKLQLQKDRATRNLILIREYKASKGCMDCGEKDPIVLEMDHRNRNDKSFNVGDKVKLGFSLERMSEELKKCDVVCANCHRRRTAKQMGWRGI